MNFVFYNGEYYPSSGPVISVSNRGFHYADGFFESIRLVDGSPIFLEDHFSRILDSLKAYRIDRHLNFSLQYLEKEITDLAKKNDIKNGGRVRITFTRKGPGTYLPLENDMEYLIEAYPLTDNMFRLNEKGLNVDLCLEFKKDLHKLAIFKNLDCKLYIQASLFAREKGIDDALIQNYKGGIIEATSSNLFLVSNGVLYTPGLEDGPIAGTMRMQIINLALKNNIKVYECTLNPQNLLAADELFLTNAVQGIRWVGSYRTKRYFNETSVKLCRMLNEMLDIKI
jgi:branched-subunit amino acid aminotransferase/4-amino-4-deoxychorismate lyase